MEFSATHSSGRQSIVDSLLYVSIYVKKKYIDIKIVTAIDSVENEQAADHRFS